MKKICFILVLFFVLIFALAAGIWSFGIPDSYVTEKLEQVRTGPVKVRIDHFHKGLLFNFSAESLCVNEGGKELLRADEISGRLNPFRLVMGKAELNISGRLYEGKFDGNLIFSRASHREVVTFGNIEISRISQLESLGLKGKGTLSGRLVYGNKGGNLEFVLNNAELSNFTGGGIYVPLKYFHTVRGALDLSPSADVVVRSIALEGKGIYARMKGRVINRYADLDIEIMPEQSFPDSSLLMLLQRYKISEGYFDIPVKTRF